MGSRCVIRFGDNGGAVAGIYQHYEGSPEVVRQNMSAFFEAVKEQCPRDTRFGDPSYLSARYIVWQAAKFARNNKALDFRSLGIVPADSTESWTYDVACVDEEAFPVVTEVE